MTSGSDPQLLRFTADQIEMHLGRRPGNHWDHTCGLCGGGYDPWEVHFRIGGEFACDDCVEQIDGKEDPSRRFWRVRLRRGLDDLAGGIAEAPRRRWEQAIGLAGNALSLIKHLEMRTVPMPTDVPEDKPLNVVDYLREQGLEEDQIAHIGPQFEQRVRQLYVQRYGHEPPDVLVDDHGRVVAKIDGDGNVIGGPQ